MGRESGPTSKASNLKQPTNIIYMDYNNKSFKIGDIVSFDESAADWMVRDFMSRYSICWDSHATII